MEQFGEQLQSKESKDTKEDEKIPEANDEGIKLDDQADQIVDPMEKFKDQEDSMKYADRLMLLFDHELDKELKKQTHFKQQ